MFLKTSVLFCILSLATTFSFAQTFDLEEKKTVEQEGIEYGYIIKNEQIKSSKGEEYSRYEITLFATNKSGCTRLYPDRTSYQSADAPNLLAIFTCSNANGKRLTAKSGQVKARDFYVNVKVTEKEKEVTKSVKAGYIFRNGESLRENIIVLVPKGERPLIQCTANYLPEL